MPYSCWMTAKSLWFSNSELAATDVVEPLTSSPMTRGLEEGAPSATRTTLTSAPFAVSASASAELNPANPHGGGGYVLRMPKLGVRQNPCSATGKIDDRSVGTAFKVIPTWVVAGTSGVSGCSATSALDGWLIPNWLGSQPRPRYTLSLPSVGVRSPSPIATARRPHRSGWLICMRGLAGVLRQEPKSVGK